MRHLLSTCALVGALTFVGCDASAPDPAAAVPAAATSASASTFTVPVTPGASEWDYVNVDATNQDLPRTWEHPLGGIINRRWLGRRPTASSPYTYEQLGDGATDAERLLSVGQRMADRVLDPLTAAPSSNESGIVVSAGSFTLPSTWEHWQGALIVRTASQTQIPFTVTARYDRGRLVQFPLKEGPVTFGMSGGREPGGFVFIEGGPNSQKNRQDTDLTCRPESTDPITYSGQIPVNTTGAPQGARMKVGVYAQVGEFYLISPTSCTGSRPAGQSMVDVEAREFTFFRGTDETAFAVGGTPASPTTTTEVTTGTFPAFVTLALEAPTSGEAITGVFVRSNAETFFTDRTGDPKVDMSVAQDLPLDAGLHHVVLTTSTGRIARGSISVCGGINGCPGGNTETS